MHCSYFSEGVNKLIIIIFPRNASFREYYVFVRNAAAASATASAASTIKNGHFVKN